MAGEVRSRRRREEGETTVVTAEGGGRKDGDAEKGGRRADDAGAPEGVDGVQAREAGWTGRVLPEKGASE